MLNIHILYDELQGYDPLLIAKKDHTLNLRGVRYYQLGDEELTSDYVYLTRASNIKEISCSSSDQFLIILGDVDQRYIEQQGWQVLVLQDDIQEDVLYFMLQEIFDQYGAWGLDLYESILGQNSIHEILEMGTRFFANPIALFDASFKFVSRGGPLDLDKIDGTIWETVLKTGYSRIDNLSSSERAEYFQKLEEPHTIFTIVPQKEYSDHEWITISIFHDHRLYGFLAAADINSRFTAGQLSLVCFLANALEYYYGIEYKFADSNKDTAYYFDKLLRGLPVYQSIISYHLEEQGWSIDDAYRLIYLKDEQEESTTVDRGRYLISRLGEILPGSIIFSYEKGIVVITKNHSLAAKREVLKLLSDMSLYAGESMEYSDIMDIKYAYAQSRAACRLGVASHSSEFLYNFEDCYSQHIVAVLDETEEIMHLCNPRLLEIAPVDNPEKTKLFQTLETFLRNGCNVASTARILGIHRNTLLHRIEKIEDALQLELRELNAEQFLCLYITSLILSR